MKKLNENITIMWNEFTSLMINSQIRSIEYGMGDTYVHVNGPFVANSGNGDLELKGRNSVTYISEKNVLNIQMHLNGKMIMLIMEGKSTLSIEYRSNRS